VNGAVYSVSFYRDGVGASNDVDLIVEMDIGSGAWSEVARVVAGVAGGYQQQVFTFTAIGITGRFRVRSSGTALGIVNDYWYVDDIAIEELAATLELGPRLGVDMASPSTGFKVWAKSFPGGTFTLETKLPSEVVWTTRDTVGTDANQYNTVVLSASGLSPGTKYDYRLLLGGVVVHVAYVYTFALDGRLIMYQISDSHEFTTQPSYDRIRLDWETNYEPLGIPCVIVQLGDLISQEEATKDDAVVGADAELIQLAGPGKATEIMPMLYMWDDWDFAGNNSARNHIRKYLSEPDPYAAAMEMWDVYWRDHDTSGAAPSRGWSCVLHGIPIICTDSRSQRIPQTSFTPKPDGVYGNEKLTDTITTLGLAQRAWVIDRLAENSQKGLVVFVSTGTFRSPISSTPGNPVGVARDSWGIYFQSERNHILTEGWIKYGAGLKNTLVVLSGDDHWNVMWKGIAGAPVKMDGTEDAIPGAPIACSFREFKCKSGDAIQALFDQFYGSGLFSDEDSNAVIRWDLRPSRNGTDVKARVSWVRVDDGLILNDTKAGTGDPGDFWYSNGTWTQYTASGQADRTGSEEQVWPPDNGKHSGVTFTRSYTDDISGLMYSENELTYDDDDRLRAKTDIGKTDRDTLMESFEIPEEPDEEPLK
jgi:hypothetical protein